MNSHLDNIRVAKIGYLRRSARFLQIRGSSAARSTHARHIHEMRLVARFGRGCRTCSNSSGHGRRRNYLARFRAIDLFLDTWHYTAGTTASDAFELATDPLRLVGIWQKLADHPPVQPVEHIYV